MVTFARLITKGLCDKAQKLHSPIEEIQIMGKSKTS